MRECLSCGKPLSGNRAKEHVVPQWLLDHLGIKKEATFQAVANSIDSTIIQSQTIAADQFVEGRICDECNSGWMSKLENDSKPLLITLIDGERTVMALTEAERLLLARWATKTAFMLSFPTLLREPVEVEHLRKLAVCQDIPPGVIVAAGQHRETREFSYFQKNTWPQFSQNQPRPDGKDGRYKIALQFRKLLLLVAFWPDPAANCVAAAGVHVVIWPILKLYGCYYSGTTVPTPYDSPAVLQQFSDTLAVAY